MKTTTPIVLALCAVALVFPALAGASDSSLVSTFVTQATQFGKDADQQSKVSNRKGSTPGQVWAVTEVVRLDAVNGKRALQAEHPSTAKGKQVQTLAVKAFGIYAVAEKELELGIDAAKKHNKASAMAHTNKALKLVKQGSAVLEQAGKLADTL
jgi:hypothetical protein